MGRQRAVLHVLTAWGALLPCGGRRSPQHGGLTCPVSGFHFPSKAVIHEWICRYFQVPLENIGIM